MAIELSPAALRRLLQRTDEIALLDVREVGAFARKHLLLAVPAPLWRLELVIDALVPRRDTPVVLVDLDGSLLAEAASRLQRLGYGDVSLLAGGTLAWEAAGLEVFSGVNVPSKALGEAVEQAAGTPHLSVDELLQRQTRGDALVVIDGRTPEEFARFNLPGAHNLPNGELAWRVRELVPDPATLVVVNCAGRTRSIVGAQTLRDAGLPNPVAALENGTMAWLLAGHRLEQGRRTPLPEPTPAHRAAAREGAQRLAQRAGVRTIDTSELQRLAAEPGRTLYRFDTRSAEEYRSGHLPGWRWAPGGQLVQASDEYLGTRGARIVLADFDGVRAPVTAAWLVQLGGFEVLLHVPPQDAPLQLGDEPRLLCPDPAAPPAPWVTPWQAQEWLRAGAAQMIDVERSLAYARRHIAGALFAAPDRLPALLASRGGPARLVLSSADGVLASRVAAELRRRGTEAHALRGGNAAWFDAGLPAASGRDGILTGDDDAWYGGYAYDDEAERHARFRAYLAWEVGLVAQLQRAGAELPLRPLAPA